MHATQKQHISTKPSHFAFKMGGILSSFYSKPESLGYTRIAAVRDVEVRLYDGHWVARTEFSEGWRNQAFSKLAGYIGIFRRRSDIENKNQKRIPMTVPVLIGPGESKKNAMEFVIIGDSIPPNPTSKGVQVAWVEPEMCAALHAVDLDDDWIPRGNFTFINELLKGIGYEVDTTKKCKTAVHDMPLFWNLQSTTEIWVPVREKPLESVCKSCGLRIL